jgi:hypothetical protein
MIDNDRFMKCAGNTCAYTDALQPLNDDNQYHHEFSDNTGKQWWNSFHEKSKHKSLRISIHYFES